MSPGFYVLDMAMVVEVKESGEVCFVPRDEANRDYRRYLRWVEAGNVPGEWEEE